MKHILFLSLCLLLAGCSPHWVSSTKPAGALDKDMETCRQHAYKKFPPNLLPDSESHMRIPSGYPKGPSTMDAYGGLSFRDTTRDAREQAFQECMEQSGWHPEKLKN